jgi:hypothetical protein
LLPKKKQNKTKQKENTKTRQQNQARRILLSNEAAKQEQDWKVALLRAWTVEMCPAFFFFFCPFLF